MSRVNCQLCGLGLERSALPAHAAELHFGDGGSSFACGVETCRFRARSPDIVLRHCAAVRHSVAGLHFRLCPDLAAFLDAHIAFAHTPTPAASLSPQSTAKQSTPKQPPTRKRQTSTQSPHPSPSSSPEPPVKKRATVPSTNDASCSLNASTLHKPRTGASDPSPLPKQMKEKMADPHSVNTPQPTSTKDDPPVQDEDVKKKTYAKDVSGDLSLDADQAGLKREEESPVTSDSDEPGDGPTDESISSYTSSGEDDAPSHPKNPASTSTKTHQKLDHIQSPSPPRSDYINLDPESEPDEMNDKKNEEGEEEVTTDEKLDTTEGQELLRPTPKVGRFKDSLYSRRLYNSPSSQPLQTARKEIIFHGNGGKHKQTPVRHTRVVPPSPSPLPSASPSSLPPNESEPEVEEDENEDMSPLLRTNSPSPAGPSVRVIGTSYSTLSDMRAATSSRGEQFRRLDGVVQQIRPFDNPERQSPNIFIPLTEPQPPPEPRVPVQARLGQVPRKRKGKGQPAPSYPNSPFS